MANEVALTGLEYHDPDGNRVSLEEGSKVDKVPKDVLDGFREAGAIGEPVLTQADKDEEREELLQRIADLQAQLQAAQDQEKAPATPNPPATKTAAAAPATKTAGK
jgi:hypothetical protein